MTTNACVAGTIDPTTVLKTTYLPTGETYINNVGMSREELEAWIEHSYSTLGGGYLKYEIVEDKT